MSYTVLARKYRPQTFADLVGQEHVTRTLANAIASGRVAHAFLFTGVRGVGKTTSARILAKALDCVKGPTAEPCNECDQCKEITAGNDLDVLEIDGASNNSVEDVRRLQESIPFRPARDRFKIFIVDEVHMLSTSAFNAFLKTLEEPPPHVKFVFATTEIHKVPVTIRSRCQRYDFRLIPQNVVAGRVREILTAEKIEADDAAVAMVAREAAGSMRDALTLLDQIVAFGGQKLRGEEVARVLGIADRKLVFEVARAVLEADGAAVIHAIDAVAKQGLDMLHFGRALLELVRDLVVLRVAGDSAELVDLVDEERALAVALAGRIEVLELERAFAGLSRLVDDVARSGAPRTVLEMGLVRIATRPPLVQLAELVARLDAMERGGGGGSAGAAPAARGGGGGGGATAPGRGGARADAPSAPGVRTASGSPSPVAHVPTPASTPSPVRSMAAASGDDDDHEHDTHEAALDSKPPVPATGAGTALVSGSDWERIVHRLRDRAPAVAAVVEHGVAVVVTQEKIVLAFPEGSFFVHQAKAPETQASVMDAAETVIGARPKMEITTQPQSVTAGPTMAQLEVARQKERREDQTRKALSHPRVVEAMQIFPESAGAVDVKLDSNNNND